MGAFLIAPHIGALLFETRPTELAIYLAVGAGVFIVAIVASYLPARRAGRANPVDLLRA